MSPELPVGGKDDQVSVSLKERGTQNKKNAARGIKSSHMRLHLDKEHPDENSEELFKLGVLSQQAFPLHFQIMESVKIQNGKIPLLNSILEHAG